MGKWGNGKYIFHNFLIQSNLYGTVMPISAHAIELSILAQLYNITKSSRPTKAIVSILARKNFSW